MKFTLLIALAVILFISCKTSQSSPKLPKAVNARLTEWKTASPCPDSHLDEMTFRGKPVYVFAPGTCGADMFTEVYNSDGKLLGNLGGITGNTTIEGEDFDKAKQVRRVWSR